MHFSQSAMELEMINCNAKANEIWNLGKLVTYMWGTLDLVVFKVIQCTCLKMACYIKTAGRAKVTEIWYSGTRVTYKWGTFDIVVFRVILGSYSVHLSENGL